MKKLPKNIIALRVELIEVFNEADSKLFLLLLKPSFEYFKLLSKWIIEIILKSKAKDGHPVSYPGTKYFT